MRAIEAAPPPEARTDGSAPASLGAKTPEFRPETVSRGDGRDDRANEGVNVSEMKDIKSMTPLDVSLQGKAARDTYAA